MKINRMTNILVIGLGKSGLSAVEALMAEFNAEITVTDNKAIEDISGGFDLIQSAHVNYLEYQSCIDKVPEFDLIVKSPGVPSDDCIIKTARKAEVEIIDELELGFQLMQLNLKVPEEQIISVTGTNGKTTTTNIIGEILKKAGYKTRIAGNVGLPLTKIAREIDKQEKVVLEVSSFQLDFIKEFRPKVAVLLNITPDHLDWHGSFASYKNAKARIFMNQDREDISVFNINDPHTPSMSESSLGRHFFFGKNLDLKKEKLNGVSLVSNYLMARLEQTEFFIIDRDEIQIPGEHNLENIMAATAAVFSFITDYSVLAETLSKFKGVAHRLERVKDISGVEFVNDSKGTNPEAACTALTSFSNPIILIAGGKDKGADFTVFAQNIAETNVAYVYLLGETKNKLASALDGVNFHNYQLVENLDQAVITAYEMSCVGDVILLSPGCASWDMYTSFERRGEHFKQLVNSFQE